MTEFAPRSIRSTDTSIIRNAVGYLRRSTDRQEQSLADQRRAIEGFALVRQLKILRYYTDDAISGTNTSRRKAFLEMIAAAQQSPATFAHIIVYDVKRFGRVDNDEAGYYRHMLRRSGIEVLYVSENFAGDGTDDLLRPVKQWQAREESRDLAKVTIRGLLSKAPGGWWMGGAPPFGYDLRYVKGEGDSQEFLFIARYMPDRTKQILDEQGRLVRTLEPGDYLSLAQRDRSRLVLSTPERVALVRRIFRMSVEEKLGYLAIARALTRDAVPSPRGLSWGQRRNAEWNSVSIRSILRNPVYVGDMVWNRRNEGRFFKISHGQATTQHARGQKLVIENPEADWIRTPNSHPAIVSRREFELATLVRRRERVTTAGVARRARPVGGTSGARAKFLLTGLVTCARCGSPYSGLRNKPRRVVQVPESAWTTDYLCGGYFRGGTRVCTAGRVEQEALEAAVVRAVLGFYGAYCAKGGTARLRKVAAKALGRGSRELRAERSRLAGQETGLRRTIKDLTRNAASANRMLVEQCSGQMEAQRLSAQLRIEELQRSLEPPVDAARAIEGAMRFIRELPAVLARGRQDVRILALRRAVESVVYDARTRTATLKVQAFPVAEGMGVLKEIEVSVPRPTCGEPKTDALSTRISK